MAALCNTRISPHSIVRKGATLNEINRRDTLRFASASLLAGIGTARTAAAEPVMLRLGYGGAAEEQVWLLIAKPELGKDQGESSTNWTRPAFRARTSAPRRSRPAPSIFPKDSHRRDFRCRRGRVIESHRLISRESSRGFSTAFYVLEKSPTKSVPDLKGKIVGINGFSTAGHLWLKAALKSTAIRPRRDHRASAVSSHAGRPCVPARSMSESFHNPSRHWWKSRSKSGRY